jgi:effector-binding domain-containing protein
MNLSLQARQSGLDPIFATFYRLHSGATANQSGGWEGYSMGRWVFKGFCLGLFALCAAIASPVVSAQSAAPTIEAAPLSPPSTGSEAPKVEPTPTPNQPQIPQGALAASDQPMQTLTSLAPPVSEVTLPDSLDLVAKPALIVHGKAQWETAYDEIRGAFTRGRAAAAKAGLTVTGYPLTVFVETNDASFIYDAILPLAAAPASSPTDFPADIKFGLTPAGKAIRFSHLAAYDEIDGAYEQITAYLDAKDIVVKDAFIEEYLVFGETSASPATTINIFVQLKK